MAMTPEEKLAKADKLAEQVRQLRAEARKQAKEQARKAKAAEQRRIQRDAVALVTFAKQVHMTVNGEKVSIYDYLASAYEREQEKETAAKQQQAQQEKVHNESEE